MTKDIFKKQEIGHDEDQACFLVHEEEEVEEEFTQNRTRARRDT